MTDQQSTLEIAERICEMLLPGWTGEDRDKVLDAIWPLVERCAKHDCGAAVVALPKEPKPELEEK